jgi:hypothetical protein
MNVEKTKVRRIKRQPYPIKIMIDKKQLENVEYFNYLGSKITNDARCTREIKSRIAMAKADFNKMTLFTSKLDLNLRKKLVKCYIWSTALYGVETWTLRTADEKYLESFEMWRWRRMEKITWTDRVRNEEVLHRVKEERNILHTTQRRKANWIGHILRRNYLLKNVIEGKLEGRLEMTGRRGRRRKQLLYYIIRICVSICKYIYILHLYFYTCILSIIILTVNNSILIHDDFIVLSLTDLILEKI